MVYSVVFCKYINKTTNWVAMYYITHIGCAHKIHTRDEAHSGESIYRTISVLGALSDHSTKTILLWCGVHCAITPGLLLCALGDVEKELWPHFYYTLLSTLHVCERWFNGLFGNMRLYRTCSRWKISPWTTSNITAPLNAYRLILRVYADTIK